MGGEILGTKSYPGQELPECDKAHETEIEPEDMVVVPQIVVPSKTTETCEEKVKRTANAGFGAFIPQCNADGTYASMQCWGSTGSCWCVDPQGNEILGTKSTPGQDMPECGTQ